MKGSAVMYLSQFYVQVNILHCTIVSVKSLKNLVGTEGFEPPTPSPPVKCATRLRYAPINDQLIALKAPSDKAIPRTLKGVKLGFRAFRSRQLAAHAA